MQGLKWNSSWSFFLLEKYLKGAFENVMTKYKISNTNEMTDYPCPTFVG